jgi:electron transport complex protein RnfE
MELTVLPHYDGFLLMLLPPGGFVVMGLLLAAGRYRRALLTKYAQAKSTPAATEATA